MDLVILVVLIGIVVFIFKKFSSFIYFIAIVDILLRILTFIKNNTLPEIKSFIAAYFPESIPNIIGKYARDDLYTILVWAYVIIMMIFLFYVTRTFIRKKKF